MLQYDGAVGDDAEKIQDSVKTATAISRIVEGHCGIISWCTRPQTRGARKCAGKSPTSPSADVHDASEPPAALYGYRRSEQKRSGEE